MSMREHESKLPAWVRNELAKLRSDLELSQAELRSLNSGEKTSILLDPYGYLPEKYVPDRAAVRFYLSNNEYIDVSLRNGELLIIGSERIQVMPSASNVVTISSVV